VRRELKKKQKAEHEEVPRRNQFSLSLASFVFFVVEDPLARGNAVLLSFAEMRGNQQS